MSVQTTMQPGSVTGTMQAADVASPAATASYFDRMMGRQPSKVPEHLSRVLYIPRHDTNTLHFPIYEARDRYRDAVQETLMGSTLFTTKLGFMETPQGNDMKDQISYLATMTKSAETSSQVHLERRDTGTWSCGADILTSSCFENTSPAIMVQSDAMKMAIHTSYPIPDSISGKDIIRHPHFRFSVQKEEEKDSMELEWRINPRDGILRYTLVRVDEESGETVCAIYHHLHWELSLAVPYSEGVLLLPETQSSSDMEEFVIASLLGVLARLRMSSNPPRERQAAGWFGRMVRCATGVHHTSKGYRSLCV